MNHTILNISLFLIASFICFSCKTENADIIVKKESIEIEYPAEFLKGLSGQEGLDLWKEMKYLEYEIIKEGAENEIQKIDLENRKTRIESKNWTLGFDGKEVWLTPNKEAFGSKSARFYHNLVFYFFASPYVLADPGVNYEVREPIMVNERKLIPVAVSFNNGIGDAPEDEYIAHFDAETNEMYLLLYTVTYYSKEKGKKFNAIVFDEWETLNGIKLPNNMKGYTFADGQLGDMRYERKFENIKISKTKPDQSLFEMPENAEIDSLQ